MVVQLSTRRSLAAVGLQFDSATRRYQEAVVSSTKRSNAKLTGGGATSLIFTHQENLSFGSRSVSLLPLNPIYRQAMASHTLL